MLLNASRASTVLKDNQLDALIATTPENVLYLGGYWAMSQWVRRGPQAYVLYGRTKAEPCIITSTSLLDLVADQNPGGEVRRFSYFRTDVDPSATLSAEDQRQVALFSQPEYKGAVEALAAAITDAVGPAARIGIDELGITPQAMEELIQRLPQATFVRSFKLFETIRAIKMPEEIARLRKACSITEQSIDRALEAAAEGMTELEMARVFHSTTTSLDGVPVTGCIGFGDRSAMSNVQPSSRPLARGDVIRFDVGCRYRHYRSDISRIASFGEPTAKVRDYHNALWLGVQRAHEIARPGLRVATLFNEVVDTVRRNGIPHYERSHVGHGIGIDGYDPPNIAADSGDVLAENMVVCVETPYYELGFAGLQVEDMILITRDGSESLMARDGRLRILPT